MRIFLGVMVLGCFIGCSGMGESPTIRSAEQAEASGHVDRAIEQLEAARIHHPQTFDTRIELGQAYYHAARKALDAGRQEEYIRMLGHALDEFV